MGMAGCEPVTVRESDGDAYHRVRSLGNHTGSFITLCLVSECDSLVLRRQPHSTLKLEQLAMQMQNLFFSDEYFFSLQISPSTLFYHYSILTKTLVLILFSSYK